MPNVSQADAVDLAAERLLADTQRTLHVRIDRMFAALMAFQWVAGVACALFISPQTWIGGVYEVHVHVLAAVLLGGLITALPIAMAVLRPGELLTRHVIAAGQMLFSALLIHLSGGRIETHFHVFGSLAFLAFYRDWRPLLTATVVVAVDHLVRGLFWPQSVFGIISASQWRWAEHAGWVVFEDLFLFLSCAEAMKEMRNNARTTALMRVRSREATELAKRITAGDLTVDLPEYEGEDEMGEMFSALKRMQDELRGLESQAQAVADGDLTVSPEGSGDLKQSFRRMLGMQRRLVEELSETSSELGSSSREILETLRQQEQVATEQAGAVEEARRTMDSLLSAAEQIADTSRGVHENAQRTRSSSESTAERASQLNQLTTRIGDLLAELTKIADRSDILALNAALEGTKAGDAGKGFILVADEMRRLAESVMSAAKDIRQLVDDIRQASQASVLATEEGVKLSVETTRSAESIRLTSQQQRTGTEQATHSMNEISQLMAQTASGAKQNTAAVADLSQRALRLQELLAPFELPSSGNGGARA
jgi:methyl-accepting chemotaxis protein